MKNLFLALFLILIFNIVGFLLYQSTIGNKSSLNIPNQNQRDNDNQVACTMEAKICADGTAVGRQGPSCEFSACPYEDRITIQTPYAEQLVFSPLRVEGEAIGSWFFEASFPIILKDGDGKVLAQGFATAEGDWMTADFVPFTATLTFEKPATETGTLIFKKDNPSGLPENDDSLEMPVRFE